MVVITLYGAGYLLAGGDGCVITLYGAGYLLARGGDSCVTILFMVQGICELEEVSVSECGGYGSLYCTTGARQEHDDVI